MERTRGPTWHGDRRVVESGVPSTVLVVTGEGGPVYVVGGKGAGSGSALIASLHAAANMAVRNPADAAALELHGSVRLSLHGCVLGVGVDDEGILSLSPGNQVDVSPGRARVRYLAIAGGIDTQLRALGTEVAPGVAVRAGSRLGVLTSIPARVDLGEGGPIALEPVPHPAGFEAAALDALVATGFTAGRGDRAALRLAIPADRAAAMRPRPGATGGPARFGTVTASPEGELVVVGPAHPPVCAYPALGQVVERDLGRLFARRPGAPVRFTVA